MDRTARARRRAARFAAGVGVSLAIAAAPPAQATTVRSVSVGELVSAAALVFDGRVLSVRTEEPRGPASIRSCARFEVFEVLKGPAVAGPLELCFAGGHAAGMSRRVAGVTLPEVGERGFYFVEDLEAPLVHPLYGWAQGHFRVSPGPVEVVTTEDGQPVVALEADGPHPGGPGHGVARGARVARPGARSAAALDATAFRARVRALLGE
jgi:hypothetical protein